MPVFRPCASDTPPSPACWRRRRWPHSRCGCFRSNVRVGYAQVLHVEPVYQTYARPRSRRIAPTRPRPSPRGTLLSRITQAVKGAITRDGHKTADAARDCQPTTVQRTFRTPIAYDVDYIYKGMKFRSWLANDPGNMLRVRCRSRSTKPPRSGQLTSRRNENAAGAALARNRLVGETGFEPATSTSRT